MFMSCTRRSDGLQSDQMCSCVPPLCPSSRDYPHFPFFGLPFYLGAGFFRPVRYIVFSPSFFFFCETLHFRPAPHFLFSFKYHRLLLEFIPSPAGEMSVSRSSVRAQVESHSLRLQLPQGESKKIASGAIHFPSPVDTLLRTYLPS